jgi:ABC-2 type transport system permease protein
MGKLMVVIKREYLERVRTRWFVIGTVLGPIFFSGLLFVPPWLARREAPSAQIANIEVLDATGRGLGARFRTALRQRLMDAKVPPTGNTDVRVLSVLEVPAAESAAAGRIIRKQVQGYLVLDSGAVSGNSARYVGRNASSIGDVDRMTSALRETVLAMRLEREGLNPARIDSLTRQRLTLSTERMDERGRGGSGRSTIIFAFAIAFLLYMSIVLYGQAVLRGVLEEKSSRVAEVVLSSIKPSTLLAGKVIGVGAVGLTQQVVWVIATMYIGSYAAPLLRPEAEGLPAGAGGGAGAAIASTLPDISIGTIALILGFFLLGYTLYSSLYAAMGSTVNSEQEAQQALTPVLLLIISSVILIQPVMLNPSSPLSHAVSLIPFSAPILMPLRMSLIQVSSLEIAASVAGLVLTCVLTIWLAARIYRVGLLMYGKRPSYRELARWIAYRG